MAKKFGCLPIIVIGLIITLVIASTDLEVFWIFFGLAMACFLLPELENSMDRVYLGREIAQNDISKNDVAGFILLIIELVFDVILNLPNK